MLDNLSRVQAARHHASVGHGGVVGQELAASQGPGQVLVEVAGRIVQPARRGGVGQDGAVARAHRDVTVARHPHAGLQQDVARFCSDRHTTAGGGDRRLVRRLGHIGRNGGVQRHLAPARVELDVSALRLDAQVQHGNVPAERANLHLAGGRLLADAFDLGAIDLDDSDIARGGVQQIHALDLGFDGVGDRTDAPRRGDDEFRLRGDDVSAAVGSVNDAAAGDHQLSPCAADATAQFAERDDPARPHSERTSARVDDRIPGHGQGARAGLDGDVATRSRQVAGFGHDDTRGRVDRDRSGACDDGLVERDRARARGQAYRIGQVGGDRSVEHQRTASNDTDHVPASALETQQRQRTGLPHADGLAGLDVKRRGIDAAGHARAQHHVLCRLHRDRTRLRKAADLHTALQRHQPHASGTAQDRADHNVATRDDVNITAVQRQRADVQVGRSLQILQHHQVTLVSSAGGARQRHRHLGDRGRHRQVVARLNRQRTGGDPVAQRQALTCGQAH